MSHRGRHNRGERSKYPAYNPWKRSSRAVVPRRSTFWPVVWVQSSKVAEPVAAEPVVAEKPAETPVPLPEPKVDDKETRKGLTGAQIALIVGGIVGGILLLAGGTMLIKKVVSKKGKSKSKSSSDDGSFDESQF